MSILAAVLLASGCYKNVWHTARGSLAAKMRDAISLGIVYIAQVQYEGNLAEAHRTGLCRLSMGPYYCIVGQAMHLKARKRVNAARGPLKLQ